MPWYAPPEGTASSGGAGSVTSVGVTADSPIVVAGSPVTDAGTINLSLPTYSRKAQFSAQPEPWSPIHARGIIFYLNVYNGNMLWQDDPTQPGPFSPCIPNLTNQNRLGMSWCPVNGNYIVAQTGPNNRPYLKSDSTKNAFLGFSGNQALRVDNANSQFAFFYSSGVHAQLNLTSGNWTMGCKFRVSYTGARQGLFDANGRTGSRIGMGLVFEGSANSNFVSFQIGNGSTSITNPVSSNAAVADGVTWNYVIASGNGTTAFINLNGTVTSAAITQANYIPLSASGVPQPIILGGLKIGSYITDTNYFSGELADCFIANTNWGQQQVDVANWISFNPPFGYYNTNELKYNGILTSSQIFDMSGISGAATEWLEPRQVRGLFDFTDCTDIDSMWTSASRAGQIVIHGATRVSASGDKVGYIENKAATNNANPSGLMRMAYSPSGTSFLPAYHTNVVNGKGAVYFNGFSPTAIPGTGEQSLLFYNWSPTPKTWFIAYKLVPGLATNGSHLLSTGTTAGRYVGVSSSGTVTESLQSATLTTPVLSSGGQFNILEGIQNGGMATILVNGNWQASSSSSIVASEFKPGYMGRPAVTGQDLNGYVAYKICYNGVLDAETRRRVRGWIADQLGITSYVNTAY